MIEILVEMLFPCGMCSVGKRRQNDGIADTIRRLAPHLITTDPSDGLDPEPFLLFDGSEFGNKPAVGAALCG